MYLDIYMTLKNLYTYIHMCLCIYIYTYIGPLKMDEKKECGNMILRRLRNETGENMNDHCNMCPV
jgi:hypothetical protein